jgi:hypothetical protein
MIMKNKLWMSAFVLVFAIGLVMAACDGTVVRVLPNTVQPGQTFTVTYEIQNPLDGWLVIVRDSTTGGCVNEGDSGTDYVGAIMSGGVTTRSRTMVAPQSGSCTFTGTYQFGESHGDCLVEDMLSAQVQVGTSCTPATCESLGYECGSVSNGCGGTLNCGTCTTGTCQAGSCIVTTNGDTGNGDDTTDECVFTLGDFCVKLWMLLTAGGLLFLLLLTGRRR